MEKKMRLRQAFAAAVLGLLASSSFAVVPWNPSSGSTGQISYSGGQSQYGLFGDPIISGNQFLFFPSNFVASSANGQGDQTSDLLQVRVNANAGQKISQIVIREQGDYAINGGGNISSFGTLYATKLAPGGTSVVTVPVEATYFNVNGAPTNNSNLTGTKNGTWTSTLTANLPLGTTSVMVVLNNILSTTTGAGSTSLIQKKVVSMDVNLDVVVPEPTSIAFIGLGGLVLLRRKRTV